MNLISKFFRQKEKDYNEQINLLIQFRDYDSIEELTKRGVALNLQQIMNFYHLLLDGHQDKIIQIINFNKNTYITHFKIFVTDFVTQLNKYDIEKISRTNNTKEYKLLLFLLNQFGENSDIKNAFLNADEHKILQLNSVEAKRQDFSPYTSFIKKYCGYYLDNKKESILNNIVEKYTKNNLSSSIPLELSYKNIENNNKLPDKTQKTINEITANYNKILTLNIDLEIKNTLKNLYEKRIPIIISKYISVPLEYRDNMQDKNGNTPTTLLNNSINEISLLFLSAIRENKQMQAEIGISELRVENRYIDGIKKHM